ncbi:MAG: GNAT family N-acetyltransferase [Planctomycetes bacterium]|nr:GNAT family N-acetyltransferase [Planctomycetota bacterium]
MNLELRPLDREAAAAFAGLILAPLRASPGEATCVAVGALVDGRPAGAAVARLSPDGGCADLGSLVVALERRGQGVGAALVAEVERLAAARGARALTLVYAPGRPSTPALRRLLARRGFEDNGPVSAVYRASAEAMTRLPWLATARLPAGFTCAPLDEVTPDERDALRAAPWFGAAWEPFAAADRHRERTYLNLVLRQGADVVGWVLCSRVEPNALLWHTLLVRRDLQGTGVGLALCAEALRRTVGDPSVARHVLTVDETNGPMQALVAAALAPHVPPPSRQHVWRKALPRPAPAAPGFASLSALLRARAAERPGRSTFTYLVDGTWDGPRRTLTPGELDRHARATAALLQERCRPGDRAVLLHPPGLELLGALFGCFHAGVVAVPAYPPANRRHVPRLRAILADSGAALVLTTSALAGEIAGWLKDDGGAPVPVLATDDLPAGLEDGWRERACGPDDVALLQYTSGSTTAPRGVVVPHGRLLHNLALNRAAGDLTADTRFVSWLPHFHDFGLVAGLLLPLFVDGTLVQLAPAAFLQRPAAWLEVMTRARGTFSAGPDFAYDLCARRVTPAQRARLDLSPWEIAVNGSEPVRAATLERFAAAFGPCGFRPGAFAPCYGLAEATLTVTWSPTLRPALREVVSAAALTRGLVRPPAPGDPGDRRELVASGRPIGDIEVRIVDPDGGQTPGPSEGARASREDGERLRRTHPTDDTGRPCAPDEVGEVWVRGGGVCPGYFGRAEAPAFEGRLTGEAGTFLRTGDLGFLRGDALFVVGRRDDVLVVRGRNHHPQDLEATLEGVHPALRPHGAAAVALAGAEDDLELVVVAEVERAAARSVDAAEVAQAARAALADAHGLDLRRLVLVLPGALPRTSSGKTQRRAARDLLAKDVLTGVVGEWRAPDGVQATPEAPASPRAQALEAWLAARLDERGLALDSLAALQLLSALEDHLEVRLPPDLLAHASTPAALARALEAELQRRPGDDALERLRDATATVLGQPAASLSLDAPLRDLGLNSLVRVDLVLAWEAALGRSLSVAAVDGARSLREVARLAAPVAPRAAPVHAADATDGDATDGDATDGDDVPLHPSQAALLRSPRPEAHGILVFLRTPPGLSPATLEAAFLALEQAHDALRLRFRRDDAGVWRQVVAPPGGGCALERVDARELTPAGVRARRAELLAGLRARVDLARGPVVAALLLDRGPVQPGVLVLFAHHLVMDTVSHTLVVPQLARAVDALRRGDAAPLLRGGSYAAYCRAAAGRPPAPRLAAPAGPRVRSLRHEVDLAQSQALLTEHPTPAGVEALLLSAFARAWRGPRLSLRPVAWVQDHGRFPAGGVDPALTVGYLSRRFALRLDDPTPTAVERALAAARRTLEPALDDEAAGRPDLAFEFRGELDAPRGDEGFRVLDWTVEHDPSSADADPGSVAMSSGVRRGRLWWVIAADAANEGSLERIEATLLDALALRARPIG